MTQWNPHKYLQFDHERLRPALDLMGQITLDNPRHIVDLGCGPGNVTALLQERWDDAAVEGIDSSAAMLQKAKIDYPHLTWCQDTIENWHPQEAPDLIFSNACLHWLDHHHELFVRLVLSLAPGGVLAVQMPNNFAAPTHQAIRDCLGEGHPLMPGFPVHQAEDYYGWLSEFCAQVNIWESTYIHVLHGENPVADWTKGAALRPILEGMLTDQEGDEFEEKYRRQILNAYPKSLDGTTLMSFKRLFIVAQKASA